jgi:hypothetical protein
MIEGDGQDTLRHLLPMAQWGMPPSVNVKDLLFVDATKGCHHPRDILSFYLAVRLMMLAFFDAVGPEANLTPPRLPFHARVMMDHYRRHLTLWEHLKKPVMDLQLRLVEDEKRSGGFVPNDKMSFAIPFSGAL